MSTTRRKFSKEFKSKVVLESLKERVSFEVLAKKYELTPTQISTWKSQALKNFSNLFSADSAEQKDKGIETQILYAQIGQLKVENDWLKKSYNDPFRTTKRHDRTLLSFIEYFSTMPVARTYQKWFLLYSNGRV